MCYFPPLQITGYKIIGTLTLSGASLGENKEHRELRVERVERMNHGAITKLRSSKEEINVLINEVLIKSSLSCLNRETVWRPLQVVPVGLNE